MTSLPTQRAAALLVAAALIGTAPVANGQTPPSGNARAAQAAPSSNPAYDTAVSYVTTFYPLWFTYYQSIKATPDQLVGPERVSPLYKTVVAVNVDTLYASSYLDLSTDVAVLTQPPTAATYSILVLNRYGKVLDTALPKTPGVYALIGPDSPLANVPPGATPIQVPDGHPVIIFRADKHSSTDPHALGDAEQFRQSLKLQSGQGYAANPGGGATQILSQLTYAFPFKTIADGLIKYRPMTFLSQLSAAVDSKLAPLTSAERALAAQFDALLAAGNSNASLAAGAQAAHQTIVDNYLQHVDAANWVHFTNIGAWGSNVVDRAGIAEYLQYGNNIAAAAYYHVFKDGNGQPLDGLASKGYTITFPPGSIPPVQRFWSITAYTPEAVELVPNGLHKYHVAQYTPNLQYGTDGSLTITLATTHPTGVPAANYLPIPPTAFNIMMRFYGPEPGTSIPDNTYVPPAVIPRQ